MSRLQKRIVPFVLKWVPLLCAKNHCITSNPYLQFNGPGRILQHLRFASIGSAVSLKCGGNLGELAKKSRLVREEAQKALLEYFHFTRNLQIGDAENMSKNTPVFFEKLLRRVEVGDALDRFLRYHPINEFEPFFESIGLKPSEYSPFLPQNLMFLCEDELLLKNYHVLCDYGIARNWIGKIYREAREVFQYDNGVLLSKLQHFECFGLKESLIAKVVASTPCILIGNVDQYFIEVLEYLKKSGLEFEWLEEHINVEGETYDWRRMLELIHLMRKSGLSERQLHQMLMLHPNILLECSGRLTFCLFGIMLKFGSTPSNIINMFLEFPDIPLAKFTQHLLRCYEFLIGINMDAQGIGNMMCSYPTILGSFKIKKVSSLQSALNCGEKKLCQMVKDDPCVLKKWTFGVKVDRLQEPNRVVKIQKLKTEFLLSLGFLENSKEMEKALKMFRGKGIELQERFDCLVKCGLSHDEVTKMIKASPQILNQSIHVLKAKVNFFVSELGYPISGLVSYPKLVSYTIERVKLRILMYRWLENEGSVRANLSFSTLLASPEEEFVRGYVNSHPRGHEYWSRLKNLILISER